MLRFFSIWSILSLLSLSLFAAGPLDKHPALKHSALGKKIKTEHRELLREKTKAVRKAHGIAEKADSALGQSATVENIAAWKAITTAPLAYVPFLPGSVSSVPSVHGIAELRIPQSPSEISNLKSEIAYFKSLDYNTALAVWRGESPVALSAIIRELRIDGWHIILTYGPAEDDTTTAYLDPDQFRQAFALLLPDCDALLVSWRRTSPGHWSGLPSAPSVPSVPSVSSTYTTWCDRVADLARRARPDIPLIGELFFRPSTRSVIGWCPSNISAVLVTGAGVNGLVPAGIANLARQITDKPLLSLILGPRAYYNTYRRVADSPPDYIRSICTRLEARYLSEGFAGTVTMAGDGSGDLWYLGQFYSDSLTKTKWSNTKEPAP